MTTHGTREARIRLCSLRIRYRIICKTVLTTVLSSSDKPGMISVTREIVDKWKRPSLATAAGVRAAQNLK